MGKYSLENHERYQTTKIRPANLPVLNELEWDGEVLSLDGTEDILDRLANGKPFALSIRLDGRHPAELGRRMALLGLQRHWRKGPVLVDPGVAQGGERGAVRCRCRYRRTRLPGCKSWNRWAGVSGLTEKTG